MAPLFDPMLGVSESLRSSLKMILVRLLDIPKIKQPRQLLAERVILTVKGCILFAEEFCGDRSMVVVIIVVVVEIVCLCRRQHSS